MAKPPGVGTIGSATRLWDAGELWTPAALPIRLPLCSRAPASGTMCRMRKTALYLPDDLREQLRRIAVAQGWSDHLAGRLRATLILLPV
jgi:hypothetical protein